MLLSRSTEYCGYAATSLFGTDDFDELEAQYNKVCLQRCSCCIGHACVLCVMMLCVTHVCLRRLVCDDASTR